VFEIVIVSLLLDCFVGDDGLLRVDWLLRDSELLRINWLLKKPRLLRDHVLFEWVAKCDQ